MKKVFSIILVVFLLVVFASTAMAAKPAERVKENGAEKYAFNLSGTVMNLPWGQQDVVGSDVASKLIVNLPPGELLATVTGVISGLRPNKTYTVYIAKGYVPYSSWPGLINAAAYPTFTFTTDSEGHASWHINLDEEALAGKTEFSVWINKPADAEGGAATVLISDSVPLQ